MITNAAGTLNSRIAVTATTKRTTARLAPSTSIASGATYSARTIVRIGPTTMSRNSSGSRTLPTVVRLPHALPMAVMAASPLRGSLIDTAHDRIERRHDRHRVRDEVVLHQQ